MNGGGRRRGPTVRLRLTLLYGGLFLLMGAILIAANFFLLRATLTLDPERQRAEFIRRLDVPPEAIPLPPPQDDRVQRVFVGVAREFRNRTIAAATRQSLVALGVVAVVAVALGWTVAGRVLRPLHDITDTARRISERNLDERISLEGPDDELRELAATFDALLDRLQAAFEAQRRFVANASHELRTPLAIIGAETDVTLRDPEAGVEEYRRMAGVVRDATDRSEVLIESLLALARSQSVAPEHRRVDLADLARAGMGDVPGAKADLAPAPVLGDPALLERLVRNLFDNASRHGCPPVTVETGCEGGLSHLAVSSAGERLPPEVAATLLEPFTRAAVRTGSEGAGLGLSIVAAVAEAHDGEVTLEAPEVGGLTVSVSFPAAPPEAPGEPGASQGEALRSQGATGRAARRA